MKPAAFLLGALLGLVGAVSATAGVARFDLPDLLGEYAYSQFTAAGTVRQAQVSTPWPPTAPAWVEAVLVGTMTPAVLRGDGVTVPAGDVALLGILPMALSNDDWAQTTQGVPPLPAVFEWHVWFRSPFYFTIPEPAPDAPPWRFAPELLVQLGGAVWDSHLPARFEPPGPHQVTNWFDGFTMVSPLTAHVTEAYMLVGGAAIPEPTTLAVLLVGSLTLQRRHRAPYRRIPPCRERLPSR